MRCWKAIHLKSVSEIIYQKKRTLRDTLQFVYIKMPTYTFTHSTVIVLSCQISVECYYRSKYCQRCLKWEVKVIQAIYRSKYQGKLKLWCPLEKWRSQQKHGLDSNWDPSYIAIYSFSNFWFPRSKIKNLKHTSGGEFYTVPKS